MTAYKDASEALMEGSAGIISTSIFEAKSYRPDGIRTSADLREALRFRCRVMSTSSMSYPMERAYKKTGGGLQLDSW